jgi:hypothetical protein
MVSELWFGLDLEAVRKITGRFEGYASTRRHATRVRSGYGVRWSMVAAMVAVGRLRVGKAGRCHRGMRGCRREVYCMGIWCTGRCDACHRSQKVQVRSSVLEDRIIAARCSPVWAFEEVIMTRSRDGARTRSVLVWEQDGESI